jgi:hypothetical protein
MSQNEIPLFSVYFSYQPFENQIARVYFVDLFSALATKLKAKQQQEYGEGNELKQSRSEDAQNVP